MAVKGKTKRPLLGFSFTACSILSTIPPCILSRPIPQRALDGHAIGNFHYTTSEVLENGVNATLAKVEDDSADHRLFWHVLMGLLDFAG
jgi:hypothetical protein